MTVNGIHIQNVYYMLAYAFKALREGVYADFTGEDFDDAEDLFGEILSLGISAMLKRGLYRMYVEVCEGTQRLSGKIDIGRTIHHQSAHRNVIACRYDEYTVNNPFNQIIKSTALALLRTGRLKKSGDGLKRVLPFLVEVSEIDIRNFAWGRLRYERNNQNYLMLINICKLVVDGLILQERDKGKPIRTFSVDEKRLAALYENFIRAYYDRHYNLKSAARQIAWDVPQGTDTTFLPNMIADVMLQDDRQTLIIDAKFYGTILSVNMQKESVRNAHLYQILTYVNNQQALQPCKKVGGMLLYAKTAAYAPISEMWTIGDHDIAVRTLDLAFPFSSIAKQLDDIVQSRFCVQKRA